MSDQNTKLLALNKENNKKLYNLCLNKDEQSKLICVDVSNQIIAAQALLKKANLLILKQHIHHCVKDAFKHDNADEKIDEVIEILSKMTDK